MSVPEKFAQIAAKVNNWGRWGDDDQLGTLNFLTDETRKRAAGCVRTGKTFALGLALSEAEGIQKGVVPARFNPIRTMSYVNVPLGSDPDWICSNEDVVTMPLQCATHWDGIAHVSYGGRIYNGYPSSSVSSAGASLCGIHLVNSLVARGVLLDVPRALGVDVLEAGHPISREDLDAACEMANITVESGDVILVRTGQMARLKMNGRFPGAGSSFPVPNVLSFGDVMNYMAPTPGLTMATAQWFYERDVAAVATDTYVFEVLPCEDDDIYLPVHLLHLVEMGMTQGQNWLLDDLAEDCSADGVYEFFLDATPLPFTNGLGSPLNPVAIK